MNRAAFTGSIARKIEIRSERGDAELLKRSLTYLSKCEKMTTKPAFTPHHKVSAFVH
jgi:hypothetical protein